MISPYILYDCIESEMILLKAYGGGGQKAQHYPLEDGDILMSCKSREGKCQRISRLSKEYFQANELSRCPDHGH